MPAKRKAATAEEQVENLRIWRRAGFALPRRADGDHFEKKMQRFADGLPAWFAEPAKLEQAIKENLGRLGFPTRPEEGRISR